MKLVSNGLVAVIFLQSSDLLPLRSDEKLIRAVDYASGFLVNETIDGLQGTINYFLLEGSSNQEETLCQYDDLSRHLTLVRNVLMVQFSNHLSRDGDVHTTCMGLHTG